LRRCAGTGISFGKLAAEHLGGISYKVLTETLRRAERDGLIARHLDDSRIETTTLCELTDLGRSLGPPLSAMAGRYGPTGPRPWTGPPACPPGRPRSRGPGGGGTLLAEGSHHVAARILSESEPDGLEADVLDKPLTVLVDQEGWPGVVEVVAEEGDVVLAHPLVFHSANPNRGARPRVMAQPAFSMTEPMCTEGDDLYPVEIPLAPHGPTAPIDAPSGSGAIDRDGRGHRLKGWPGDKISQIRLSNLVVLGWHYTNTPTSTKDQVAATLDGGPIGLPATNVPLRAGDGDR